MTEENEAPEAGSADAVIEQGIALIATGLFMMHERSPTEAEFELACLAHYFTDLHQDAIQESMPVSTTVH